MSGAPFAMTVPTPLREAVIVCEMSPGKWFSIPITTEEEAYRLCRQVGVPGFWRLKERQLAPSRPIS